MYIAALHGSLFGFDLFGGNWTARAPGTASLGCEARTLLVLDEVLLLPVEGDATLLKALQRLAPWPDVARWAGLHVGFWEGRWLHKLWRSHFRVVNIHLPRLMFTRGTGF